MLIFFLPRNPRKNTEKRRMSWTWLNQPVHHLETVLVGKLLFLLFSVFFRGFRGQTGSRQVLGKEQADR